ncbi:hypothetical protein A1Q2_06476 [Trichosporon asahii var. asahii CBS 8904]|uniref:Serine hydrolase domain-containing protein n=1 Tax=Trichosporon asahii var. asahii (strain CBS 8904) TaxID=1220162 RepID=K1VJC9_TRIAC|nr:hypothetical protein A1Q2_06476 [Trichosporon asahii var. asahii CBS 8904]
MTIKILALCGFTQNATIYSKQVSTFKRPAAMADGIGSGLAHWVSEFERWLGDAAFHIALVSSNFQNELGAIRKTCKNAEFVFLEPPVIVQKADMPWNQRLDDFASSATTEEAEQTPETTPRAWWLSPGDRSVYKHFDETVSYVYDFMQKNGPFDGIMGFSQGACMAAVLGALPGLHPNFPEGLPKPKFIIAVGGFKPEPKNPDFSNYFPLSESLPVLHVLGDNDVVVTPERSQSLIDATLNGRVEHHTGGHFTPSKASWRHFLNAYINTMAEGGDQNEIPAVSSFGPSGANTPATGNGTPRTQTPTPGPSA